ncbi:MAG TPA: ATP-binding protein [Myxococcaceae bacterium]|nr:ATP-binding protein [Myxococcaceae bacterium]
MTIRTKVFLFAVVALGLVGVMGVELHQGSSRGYQFRTQVVATYEQLGLYGQMHEGAWAYLQALLSARREGRDTQSLRSEYGQRLDGTVARLREHLERKARWAQPGAAAEGARHLEAVHQAHQRWATLAEEQLRSAALEPEEPGRAVFAMFEQQVAPRIAEAIAAEQAQLELLRPRWDWNILRGQTVSYGIPGMSLLLVGGCALLILLPMQRQLRALRTGAERMGHGDFEVALPVGQRDELGSLARAFNRMAEELRQTLKEKHRLLEAEAQAAEREVRRDNALLEEKVRKRTAELEQVNAQLRFADRLATVGRLAAGVAHEINNPLAFVLSNLTYLHEELIRDEPLTPHQRREMLSAVADAYEGAGRVRLIAQELKTLSRQDEGERSAVDMGAVVHSAVKMASMETRHRAQVVEEYQELPLVMGNPARLGQVFLNLLINAAQAIPPGSPEKHRIRVAGRADAEHVTVEVSDTGKGIAPEMLERIFDPFFTTKPAGEGTGLGLSISHSIITSLGGTIDVESQMGQGTTFRVTLPLAPAAAGKAAPAIRVTR